MGPDLIEKVVAELKEAITGGILSKITQPEARSIVLRVFIRGNTQSLLLCTNAPNERLHLTQKKMLNPMSPPRFCALLRSRIGNAVIKEITKIPGERIVEILLETRRDEGDGEREKKIKKFRLRLELTGRSANIILLNEEGTVVDALRHFRLDVSPRAVMPGILLSELPPREEADHGESGKVEALPNKDEGETWNEFTARYYSELTGDEGIEAYRRELKRVIEGAVKKARKLVKNLEGDREKAEANVGLNHYGELILPNMGSIRRGATEALLMDYTVTPPAEVAVPLDKKLGPRENAELYFKKSKKARRALEILAERIPECEGELQYVQSLGYDLQNCETLEDFEEIEAALIKHRYMRRREGREKGETRKSAASPVKRKKSSEGITLLLGKNARGNDQIVKKESSKGDIWLHAKDVAGSHVLIKTGGRAIADYPATLSEAAALAAWHSKARSETKAEVLYTDVKHVSKPAHAKPGQVMVREFKVILVEPGER
ncbi:MAG: NFACT family protein [Thermodesulfobacteriota bacterium]